MRKETIFDRLESFKRIDSRTNCWIFTGQKINGYGTIWFHGYTYSVHRVSAHLYLGLDLDNDNIQVNHKRECPNRSCFNPEHLYLGNQAENQQDSVAMKTHRNSKKILCHKGHPLDKIAIRSNGKIQRVCGTCARERDRKRLRRKR